MILYIGNSKDKLLLMNRVIRLTAGMLEYLWRIITTPKFHDAENWEDATSLSYEPDVDGILPITDEEYLEDDIVSRLCSWLKAAYGADTLEENLDFIAGALGGKGNSSREIIRNYFLKDFFKDHCKTYQKRPIYWLFDSGKQNGFKALIYLHRYTPDTIGNLRVDYLPQNAARLRVGDQPDAGYD